MTKLASGLTGAPIDTRGATEGDGLVLRDGVYVNENLNSLGTSNLIGEHAITADAAYLEIANIPGSYKDLRLEFQLRSDDTADFDHVEVQVGNGSVDTGTNYRSYRIYDGTSGGQNHYDTVNEWLMDGAVTGDTADANLFGYGTMIVSDYAETTQQRHFTASVNHIRDSSTYFAMDFFGVWENTADAIDVIRLTPGSAANWVAGSTFRIYGEPVGGQLMTGYSPILDYKPTTDTLDDEFASTTLDGKWTEVTGSVGTVDPYETGTVEKYDLTTRPGWLLMQTGRAGAQNVRLRQDFTLPDGESIIMAVGHASGYDAEPGTGISQDIVVLALNDNDTTELSGNYIRIGVMTVSGGGSRVVVDDGTTSIASHSSSGGGSAHPVTYLRLARSGTGYRPSFSVNGGVSWIPLGAGYAIGATLNNIWINGRNAASHTAFVPILAVDWIRQGSNNLDPWSHSGLIALDTVPEWMTALDHRVAGETLHGDDQFFSGSIGGTAVTPTGTAVWTQTRGLLSCIAETQSNGDLAVRLYPLTPTASPVTFDTAFVARIGAASFSMVGLVFTDGTTASSNAISFTYYPNRIHDIRSGTLTNMATSEGSFTGWDYNAPIGIAYMRLIWSAANTFKVMESPDGISWSQMGTTTFSFTMTPTYIGVVCSAYASALSTMAGFHYLRVAESDLSI